VADTLTKVVAKTTDPYTLRELAQALSAVAARMQPADASRVRAQATVMLIELMAKTSRTSRYVLRALVEGLSALAAHMEPKDVAQVARALTQVMARTTNDLPALYDLAEGLSVLAIHLEPQESARLHSETTAILTQAAATPTRLLALYRSAWGPLVVAGRLEPQAATQATAVLIQAMTKTAEPYTLHELAHWLSAVLTRVDPPELPRRSAAVVAVIGPPPGIDRLVATPILLDPALEPLPCRLSTQQLVDLLKQPTCVGLARRVVLDQLENRYRQDFADHWAFVRFAQEQNLGLDFTSPPKRPAN